MDWVKQLNIAIRYIEDHLTGTIEYDELAKMLCCSTYQFQRMFAFMNNVPLFYTSDCFMEVSEEIADMFKEFDRKEAAYRLRTYRHKAYYSLDRDDGLEHISVHRMHIHSINTRVSVPHKFFIDPISLDVFID